MLYVRPPTPTEGKKIEYLLKRGKDRALARRAQVVALSDQGMSVGEIAEAVYLCPDYVRELIGRFNRHDKSFFAPINRPGRPVIFTEELKAEVVEYALCPPKLLGEPFSIWSLDKLRQYLIKQKIIPSTACIETIRTILHKHKVHLQRTKTWKESDDPDFNRKKNG
jgi:transposase